MPGAIAKVRHAVPSAVKRMAVRVVGALPVCALLDSPGLDKPLRNVVVVTGPHRSGTTIMGRLLEHAPRTFLVHEPFNPDWGLQGVSHRYPYLRSVDTGSAPARTLRRFLTTGQGQWMGHGQPLPANHKRMRVNRANVRGLRPLGYVAIVKDPFLLMSLGWINTALSERPPIVTLRHPGAWVMSLLRRSMHPRAALRSIREQACYGDPVVGELMEKHDWENADIVRAGAATWACLVRMLDVQLEAGAKASVVRMEDFAADPYAVMLDVYRTCGLRPPRDLRRVVDHYTGSQNVVIPAGRVLHELRRDSASLANAWRDRLDDDQQRTIREITEPVADRWYPAW